MTNLIANTLLVCSMVAAPIAVDDAHADSSNGFFGALRGIASKLGTTTTDSPELKQAATIPPPAASSNLSPKQTTQEIQKGLSALGYSPGPADGIAGEQTRRAIFDFQLDNGIPADGEPTPDILNVIVSKKPGNARGNPQAVAAPSASTAPGGGLIGALKGIGSKLAGPPAAATAFDPSTAYPAPAAGPRLTAQQKTRAIQIGLSQRGYSPGPADGVMGEKTKRAIFNYQIDNGMPADGEPSVTVLNSLLGNPTAGYGTTPAGGNSFQECLARVSQSSGPAGQPNLTQSQYAQLAANQGAGVDPRLMVPLAILAPFTGGASLLGAGALAGASAATNPGYGAATATINPAQMTELMRCMGDK